MFSKTSVYRLLKKKKKNSKPQKETKKCKTFDFYFFVNFIFFFFINILFIFELCKQMQYVRLCVWVLECESVCVCACRKLKMYPNDTRYISES